MNSNNKNSEKVISSTIAIISNIKLFSDPGPDYEKSEKEEKRSKPHNNDNNSDVHN